MNTHELKLETKYFDDIVSGRKTFELRKNDRDYKVGDLLFLNEIAIGEYTCMAIERSITYILKDCPEFGLMDGYVILGIN